MNTFVKGVNHEAQDIFIKGVIDHRKNKTG